VGLQDQFITIFRFTPGLQGFQATGNIDYQEVYTPTDQANDLEDTAIHRGSPRLGHFFISFKKKQLNIYMTQPPSYQEEHRQHEKKLWSTSSTQEPGKGEQLSGSGDQVTCIKRTMKIRQTKTTTDLISKQGLNNAKTKTTSINPTTKPSKQGELLDTLGTASSAKVNWLAACWICQSARHLTHWKVCRTKVIKFFSLWSRMINWVLSNQNAVHDFTWLNIMSVCHYLLATPNHFCSGNVNLGSIRQWNWAGLKRAFFQVV